MLKNGATPNFIEFKDENENVVASISTSGDLNVAGSITVNGSEVGATGPTGPGFEYFGGWEFTTTYNIGDVVNIMPGYGGGIYYPGGTFISLIDNNIDNDPLLSGNEWGLIAADGPEGPTGSTGADGGWSTAQTIKEESGTSYTIQSSDVGKLIIFTSQDPVSVTVPWSLGFSIGQRVDIFQRYNGQITVSGGAGPMPADMVFVLGTPGNKTRTALSAATLVYINSNVSGPEYALIGDLSA